jgi:molybdenum cofactor biosynthesis enzyme MoaA
LLTEELCDRMHDAGLRIMTITIGAETNEKYQRYTCRNIRLDDVLRNIGHAVSRGIDIAVHVPLSGEGIHNFEQLAVLLDKVSDLGVKEAVYFNLTESDENRDVFKKLFVDKSAITRTFSESSGWQLCQTSDEGRYYMTNGRIRVYVPSEITLVTENCRSADCGDQCQGIYAAYLIKRGEQISVRACHRRFEDGRNVYPIDNSLIENEDLEGLAGVFKEVWRFAYEQK